VAENAVDFSEYEGRAALPIFVLIFT